MDPTRAPGRRYRRRRHGEPVNAEWTAPPGAAGSLADAPPLDNPLAGVIECTFIPAFAVLSTLIYYRLTAARAAAGLS